MELEEFISTSLKSIIKGVDDVKDYAIEHGARINPHVEKSDFDRELTSYFKGEDGARVVSKINFDVAVTVTDAQESGVAGGIKVYALKLGADLNEKSINETTSRIKFDLNVILPNTEYK